jgi:predicted GIY-YIG superfamily endonuclease
MTWSVYLISTGKRTYVGSTTDPQRRLRQHNSEIRGGARATKPFPGQWKLVCWVSGFDGRGPACRWEKLVKSRARGQGARKEALQRLILHVCPSHGKRKQYEVPQFLQYHEPDPIPTGV